MKIGLVGCGRMGGPMAERLIAAGHELTVLARTPAAQAALPGEQVRWAGTIADTVRGQEAVLIVVLDDQQVRAVCLGPQGALGGMKPGATLVQHTTCDAATLAMLGQEGHARGVRVLDAALSGGPHDIAAGRLTLWVGGEERVVDELRPVLAAYASPVLFVGALGDGQRIKLVNNALFVAQVGLAIDAVRLAGALGIDHDAILGALQNGSGASRALAVVANGKSVDDVRARIGSLMRKDVDTVRQVAMRAEADLGLIGTVLDSDVVAARVLS